MRRVAVEVDGIDVAGGKCIGYALLCEYCFCSFPCWRSPKHACESLMKEWQKGHDTDAEGNKAQA